MNLTTKGIMIFSMTIIIIISNLFVLSNNSVNAINIQDLSEIQLEYKGDCGQLLKYKGSIITISYVTYTHNGVEYPAYCINKELDGVNGDLSYAVTADGIITNVDLWRTIINGYPYKSIEELGVANKEEAFSATKQAVYCTLYENTVDDYEGIGEAGERTLNALKQIVSNAQNSTESINSATININKLDENWTQDINNSVYLSKTYSVMSNVSYTNYRVQLNNNYPEGTIITDENGIEKNNFSNKENFKIMVPIQSLKDDGEISVTINTEVKTKPVIYGKSPNSNWQNYALTGYMYEDANINFVEEFYKNTTKIIVNKQDAETKEAMEGVEFNLLNEKQEIVYNNLITDNNGQIVIENLLPGEYYLEETKTNEGYKLADKLIKVELNLNEEVNIIVDNKKEEVPEVEIEKEEIVEETKEVKILPVTGM